MINIKQIYESLILEAMTLMEIWEKYYSKEITDFSIFDQLDNMDPTHTSNKHGKYLDWIIRKAWKNNKNILEDFDTVQNNLQLFHDNQRKIGKQISQIKDQYELAKIVKEFKNKKETGTLNLSDYTNQKEIEVVYNDSNWLIVVPKTVEASVFLGKNTEWCTANYDVDDNRNRFNFYNDQGPLYILINKDKPSEKYQFHFESSQYMDSEDTPIAETTINKIPLRVLDIIFELANKPHINLINTIISIIGFTNNHLLYHYKKKYSKEYNEWQKFNDLLDLVYLKDIKKLKKLLKI